MADFRIGVKVKPLNGRVLIRIMDGERKSTGGIIIPESQASTFSIGIVEEISDGKEENGYIYDHKVQKGDQVIFHTTSGYPISVDEINYKIMPESDLFAIIKEELLCQRT